MKELFKAVTNPIVQYKTRCWDLRIRNPYMVDKPIIFRMEELGLDADGNQVGQPNRTIPEIKRMASCIMYHEVTLESGKTVSIPELIETIEAYCIAYQHQDNGDIEAYEAIITDHTPVEEEELVEDLKPVEEAPIAPVDPDPAP